MDDNVVPRTRNLRPRKPYVDPFAAPRRSVRRSRARLSAADFFVVDNDEDGDWNGAADDEVEEINLSSRRSHRSHRRTSSRRDSARSTRATPEPSPKKRARKPKILLPEDVPFRDPVQPQPEADPEDVAHAPSVAFIAIFVATFPSLFEDLGRLPAPQDLEVGLLAPEPSELVEFVFRRVLGLVLNRKKEIEVGRYGSALSELHAQRNALGTGPWFPPLQWKSKGNAFAELQWYDRLELLHVLVHWSLSASDRVRQLLRQLDDEAVNPWIGADEAGNHYYIVGFDPVFEGSEEHTPFRVYKESNRLLQTVKWEPVASSAAEVQAFLDSHIKKPKGTEEPAQEKQDSETKEEVKGDQEQAAAAPEGAAAHDNAISDSQVEAGVHSEEAGTQGEIEAEPENQPEQEIEPKPEPEPETVEYDLPTSVVETLVHFLPAMYRSEEVISDRLQKEAKRARRRNDIMWQAQAISNGGGRYAGRTRGRKINYAELLRDSVGDDDDDDRPRKRRLRQRDSNYEWHEPEPETRQQRHARILAERSERAAWSSNDATAEPTPEYTPSLVQESYESDVPQATSYQVGTSELPAEDSFSAEEGNAVINGEVVASEPVVSQAVISEPAAPEPAAPEPAMPTNQAATQSFVMGSTTTQTSPSQSEQAALTQSINQTLTQQPSTSPAGIQQSAYNRPPARAFAEVVMNASPAQPNFSGGAFGGAMSQGPNITTTSSFNGPINDVGIKPVNDQDRRPEMAAISQGSQSSDANTAQQPKIEREPAYGSGIGQNNEAN